MKTLDVVIHFEQVDETPEMVLQKKAEFFLLLAKIKEREEKQ